MGNPRDGRPSRVHPFYSRRTRVNRVCCGNDLDVSKSQEEELMPLLRVATERLPEVPPVATKGRAYSRTRSRILQLATKALEIELAYWREVLETTLAPMDFNHAMRRVPGLCKDLGIDCAEEMQKWSAKYYRLEHMRRAQAVIATLRDPFVRLEDHHEYRHKKRIKNLRRRLRAGKFALEEVDTTEQELALLTQKSKEPPAWEGNSPCVEVRRWFASTSMRLIRHEHGREDWRDRDDDWPDWPVHRTPGMWGHIARGENGRQRALTHLPTVVEFMRANNIRARDLELKKGDIARFKKRLERVKITE